MGITPRALAELLGSAGYPVTERRLTDWRAKGWIPDVCRGERPAGTGRGAHYEWQDGEITAQVFTLLNMLEIRGRMETASVLTWFSGFNVPRDDIRELWAAFESLPLESALRWAQALGLDGESGSLSDAVETLVLEAQQREKKRGYSADLVDILQRMNVDPDFDARRHLPIERVEKILASDAVKRLSEEGAELVRMLSADVVRGFAVLVQDYSSGPRLIGVIRDVPDEMLAKAHADVRFLLTPYRRWVESSIAALSQGRATEPQPTLLLIGSRLSWKAGRILLRLDIALRRLGYADEVDATIALLRDIAARDDTREVVRVFTEYWQLMAALSRGSDVAKDVPSSVAEEFLMRSDTVAAGDRAVVIAQDMGAALKKLWWPHLRLVLHEAAGEGI